MLKIKNIIKKNKKNIKKLFFDVVFKILYLQIYFKKLKKYKIITYKINIRKL